MKWSGNIYIQHFVLCLCFFAFFSLYLMLLSPFIFLILTFYASSFFRAQIASSPTLRFMLLISFPSVPSPFYLPQLASLHFYPLLFLFRSIFLSLLPYTYYSLLFLFRSTFLSLLLYTFYSLLSPLRSIILSLLPYAFTLLYVDCRYECNAGCLFTCKFEEKR